MKTCIKCRVPKDEKDFYLQCPAKSLTARKGECKECSSKRTCSWSKQNPEKARKTARKYRERYPERQKNKRLKKFGLTLEGFARMLEGQKGVCAICKVPPATNKRFNVDHCHRTGRIRQLLCTKCNTALGLFKDSAELVQAAADYLSRHA